MTTHRIVVSVVLRVAIVIVALAGMIVPARAAECMVGTERRLAVAPEALDQDLKGGWPHCR